MSNFLNNIVQPMYLICSSQVFYKWCGYNNECAAKTQGVNTWGVYQDARTGEECAPKISCNCGCTA